MHPFGTDSSIGSLRGSRHAGGLDAFIIIDTLSWWRGNWWRLTPPAVPIASARGHGS